MVRRAFRAQDRNAPGDDGDVANTRRRRTRRAIYASATGLAALTAWAASEVVARTGEPAVPLVPRASHGGFHPVAGDFERDETKVEDCDGEDLSCLQQGFGNIAFDRGAKAALAAFDERIATDGGMRRRCHPIAHAIGSAALARYGDVAKAFAEGSASCASGYYHGLLERAFVGASGEKELVRKARSLCRGLRERGFFAYQCVHGLGHGLMIQTGYDLPASLAMCDRLHTGWERTSCTGGVFMENTSTAFGFRSRWLKDEDLVYPCNWVKGDHKRSCYLRVTTRILQASNYDWKRTATLCEETGSEWAPFCFRSYGRDASGHVDHEPKKVLAVCELAAAHEGDCLYGAARTIADTYADGSRAAALCENASERHRDACFSGLGLVVGLLEPSDAARRAECAGLTASHAEACVAGARAEVASSGRDAWG